MADDAKRVDPNPSFQKLVAGATRVVIRDGGDICCDTPAETLKQPVLFEIKDRDEIRMLAENIKFQLGTGRNPCAYCGHPGIDWYVGDRRVAITAVVAGLGIVRGGSFATFTPESKAWFQKWLTDHGFTPEGEQAGADQPATKPADKPPVQDQPSTPTSKDAPR